MIKKEQDPKGNAERECNADPLDVELPELYQPFSPPRGLEGATHG